ncbi:uncharacterized protein ColSpa_04859 [Colletotrichum spaethianum]|uniref:Uncharacterized protein n=1 Tax=Colletotrichum spaethianum TaxID=700344 RepID=A0AA37P1A9_9PEZI|nr:uncharacterized protein ColSpa_04859 [Colletotrichum spaethianum]GKT44678.1 hypothetical protein ColSpa_04859 [Colletotrichum spaethianum]
MVRRNRRRQRSRKSASHDLDSDGLLDGAPRQAVEGGDPTEGTARPPFDAASLEFEYVKLLSMIL